MERFAMYARTNVYSHNNIIVLHPNTPPAITDKSMTDLLP